MILSSPHTDTPLHRYLEAAQSLFETVTLVFTSSLDAHHFFLQQPQHRHRFLPHLRNLELSLTHTNDHLYLTKIPSPPATPGSNDAPPTTTTTTPPAAVILHDSPSTTTTTTTTTVSPPPSSTHPRSNSTTATNHVCFNMFCRVSMFGSTLWQTLLLQGVRTAAPKLRDLDINIGGRISRTVILDVFGTVEEDEEEEPSVSGSGSEGRGGIQSGGGGDLKERGVWEVPGRLAVGFAFGGRGYLQVGGKMVRLDAEGAAA